MWQQLPHSACGDASRPHWLDSCHVIIFWGHRADIGAEVNLQKYFNQLLYINCKRNTQCSQVKSLEIPYFSNKNDHLLIVDDPADRPTFATVDTFLNATQIYIGSVLNIIGYTCCYMVLFIPQQLRNSLYSTCTFKDVPSNHCVYMYMFVPTHSVILWYWYSLGYSPWVMAIVTPILVWPMLR